MTCGSFCVVHTNLNDTSAKDVPNKLKLACCRAILYNSHCLI